MSAKILRRCTICKNFHASYLVEDPELGKCYLCPRCWKARLSKSSEPQTGHSTEDTETKPGISPAGTEAPQSSGEK